MRKAESDLRSLNEDSGRMQHGSPICVAAATMHAAIFVSKPCCFDFEIRSGRNLLKF
jgi:hypothetical protein